MTHERCLLRHLKQAYRAIGDRTPIPADCGQLCGAACCHAPSGQESEYGMLLFPGEEQFLRKDPHFTLSCLPPPTGFHRPVWFATCRGVCNRSRRPLACRIFPCLPYLPLDEHGERSPFPAIIPDPRASIVCPLVAHGENHVDETFYEAVAAAAAALLSCPAHRAFLESLSALIDEYRRFL